MINDQLGHQKGDFLLKLISNQVQPILKSTDIIGRIGGVGISCSIGIALYPENGNNYDSLCSLPCR